MIHEWTLAEYALWTGRHALPLFAVTLALALATTCACWWALQRYRVRRGSVTPLPTDFMTLRIVIGSGVVLVSGVVFATLAGQFGGGVELRGADQIFTDALGAGVALSAMQVFASLTRLADTRTLTVLCIAVAILLVAARRPWLAFAWVVAVGGNGLINTSLKQVFGRLRPVQPEGFVFEHGFSFPSGHSSGCVVAYGMLAYLAVRLLPTRWQLPSILVAVVFILTIGASRIFLRVHFVSDVVAGFASGLAWLAICITGIELARIWRARSAAALALAASQPGHTDAAVR